MDGEGSIQVNHWRHKNLQYRLVIKLKNTPANARMFALFVVYICGCVHIDNTPIGSFIV